MPHRFVLISAWSVLEWTNRVGDVLRPGGLGATLRVYEEDGDVTTESYLQVSLLDTDAQWHIDSMWVAGEVMHIHGFGKRVDCRLWPLREDVGRALDEACQRRGLMEGGGSRQQVAP